MAKSLTPQDTTDLQDAKEKVRALDEEALGWKNLLNLRTQAKKAAKEERDIRNDIIKLGREEAKNAVKYKTATVEIKNLEKEIEEKKFTASRRTLNRLHEELRLEKEKQRNLIKTSGGALQAQALEARKRKIDLLAERNLIKDINKERNIGTKIADLFRSKEERQRRLNLDRARAGGGVLPSTATGGKPGADDKGKSTKNVVLAALGLVGTAALISKIKSGLSSLLGPLKALKGVAASGLTAPFADAAGLLTGDSLGMGGGKVNAAGATSILGGVEKLASSIPFIGGLLGGLVGAFKGMLDAVLGIEQANFKVARSMNISAQAAEAMRKDFDAVALTSDNIVVNSTRMLQSQVEIGNQLGVNKRISNDILVNDVKLRDILGLEAESRQAIVNSSITTGQNAEKLTKSLMGTVGAFNQLVGTSFTFNATMKEASQQSGVMGLTFLKYPEKIMKAVLSTKTLGFELKQLDGIAGSFLDFESSISKEMEAQVLTGRDINLTAAREAALNNDNAKLAQEITKNVGSASDYLKLNRIEQEGIAEAVGLSRDSLADVLKKQELYSKLNATDVATFNKKITLLEKQGKTQAEISKIIGEDAYNTYTQVSTAEKLTEVMEKIKKVFVDFVKNSGLFDFLTNPDKINNFIKGLSDKLASTVSLIGDIIATMLEGVGHLPFTDKNKWQGLADQVRSGSEGLAGGIRSTTNSLGGTAAPSLSATVQAGVQNQTPQQTTTQTAQGSYVAAPQQQGNIYLDGHQVGSVLFGNVANQVYQLNHG